MVKTCLFGQLLSGREAHVSEIFLVFLFVKTRKVIEDYLCQGFGLMGLLKDLSERPLNSNTMLTNIRSQISASSLSNDQKGKAMEDAKKCIADVMPVSNLVLQTFTDTKGAILDSNHKNICIVFYSYKKIGFYRVCRQVDDDDVQQQMGA